MSSKWLIIFCAAALLVPPAATAQLSDVQMEWGVEIPVRDGINLHGTIYRPADQTEPLPVILGFTPYISDVYHGKARYYAKRGYVFAAVDVRGRGNSEGEFEPFHDADKDGHDVVEWLAAQPWSNGKVAMYGASYGGWDQWATAKELPPSLEAIVPAAAAYLGTDFPFVHNVFVPYNMTWLTFTSGGAAQSTIFGDMELWAEAFSERYVNHRPFADLDEIVGNRTTHFQTWIEHPTPDEYWQSTAPTPAQLAAMDVPILTITGHYDGDQRGALQHYRMHMRHGNEAAKAVHHLVIGPWNHGGVGTSVGSVGGLDDYESGNNLAHFFWGEHPLSEHFALNLFENGLVYHTEPFETEMDLAGFIELDAWMSLDVPDTDFMVAVYEIRPDGLERLPDGRHHARPLPQLAPDRRAGDPRRGEPLSFQRLPVLRAPDREGQPPAPDPQLTELGVAPEELQQRRSRDSRIGRRRAQGDDHPSPRRRVSEQAQRAGEAAAGVIAAPADISAVEYLAVCHSHSQSARPRLLDLTW